MDQLIQADTYLNEAIAHDFAAWHHNIIRAGTLSCKEEVHT